MGMILVFLGLFLLFALAFNGSVGTDFVDRSFFASGLLMVIAGIATGLKSNFYIMKILCSLSLLCYLPMIWQRFNFNFGVDWVGFVFDIAIAAFLIFLIVVKPNKQIQPTPKSGAAD